MKPVAIIPARGGSKRIPRKNIVDINGFPMMGYPIRASLESDVFADVIVSTEDPEIASIALSLGAKVIERPAELATDESFEIDVYAQVLDLLPQKPEYFCGIYPTAIFLNSNDYKQSYAFIKRDAGIDVLMGVSHFPLHPYKALMENASGYLEMVYPKECKMRSQTYPEYVASNGTIYWFKTDSYYKYRSYYPPGLKPYILPYNKAIDIDLPEDLVLARALMSVATHG